MPPLKYFLFQDLTPASRHNFVPTLVLMKFIKRDKSLHMAILNSESVFKVINLHLEDGRRPSKNSAHKFHQINTKIRKCCVVFRGLDNSSAQTKQIVLVSI